MKKLAIITTFLLTAFAGYSQTNSNDSCVCVTPQEMRNALIKKDSLRIAMKEIKASEELIKAQGSSLISKDGLIKSLEEKNELNKGLVGNLKSQVFAMDQTNKLVMDYNIVLKKELKAQKKKTVVIAGVSLSIIGTLTYLLVQ